MDIQGKCAIVTGGASGVGFGLAAALRARGAKVLIADIEGGRAAQAAESLGGLWAQTDVTDPASLASLADQAYGQMGRVDLLVNNAGIGVPGDIHKISEANWAWLLAVNLHAIVHAARIFIPRMLAQDGPARFIATASEHALGLPVRGGRVTAYTASKHAVLGLLEGMERDYAGTNLSTAVILPGLVQSRIWDGFRNRPEKFGGPRSAPAELGVENAKGLPADVAGQRIADAIGRDEFFILTHGAEVAEVHEGRKNRLDDAFSRFAALYGPQA